MLTITNMRVNALHAPMGLDEAPSLSWTLESDVPGIFQKTCRIRAEGGGTVWDSGELASGDTQNIPLPFPRAPRTEYRVQIEVTDSVGQSACGQTRFETGLLNGFTADWITDGRAEGDGCPVFFTDFTAEGEIVSARLYASALGVYFPSVNGQRVGNVHMAPGWTNYFQRIAYQTYDVTALLGGENRLELTVGRGWYRGTIGYLHRRSYYGEYGGVIAQLHIRYADGHEQTIATDESWRWTTGCIRESEIYNGERVDFTFCGDEPHPVKRLDHAKDILVAQECPSACRIQELPAKECIHTPAGETVLDFGQILTGFVRARLHAPAGTVVKLSHAEVLDEKGNFYTINLREAKAADTIVCSGGDDEFAPEFTFHGFRYVKLEGLPAEPRLSDFKAVVVHSDLPFTGEFICSHPGLNRLQQNIQWSQRGNFLDIPTDCPQRDERLGWTGDAQVFSETAAFNMDVQAFFRKWMRDLRSEENDELGVPTVIPDVINQEGTAGWGDCAVILPWALYQAYGNRELLREQYPAMRHWIDFIQKRCGDNGLWQTDFQYGDWLALDGGDNENPCIGATDVYFVANVFYAHSTDLVRQAAQVLGLDEDAAELAQRYEKIVSAFRKEYITETGRLVSQTQTAAVLALHFGMCEECHRPRILEELTRNLHRHGDHLTTGFLGTPYLLDTLCDNGCADLAARVALQEDFPSWLYAVNMGATTIWERWNSMNPDRTISDTGMTSFNHYAYGCIGHWLYARVCGLSALEPGYRVSRVAPTPIEGLDWAQARLYTVHGLLSCRWERMEGGFAVDITIPANTEAEVILPGSGEARRLPGGSYRFFC